MIRQAISCDICSAEKRQTNHWFVAYEQGGELRVSGWSSRHRLRPGSKHLCGQTCLHKLVDEFMAKSIAVRAQRAQEMDEEDVDLPSATDASLTSAAAYAGPESARLLVPAATAIPAPVYHPGEPKAASLGATTLHPNEPRAGSLGTPIYLPQSEVFTMPPRQPEISPVPADTLRYASRRWRAEAWERERERELRAIENRPEIAERRRSSASSF